MLHEIEISNLIQKKLSRRDFLKELGVVIMGINALFTSSKKKKSKNLREAMFYKKLPNEIVQCEVCYRNCILKIGERSFCRNKENINGRLYNLIHSRPSAVQIDPIEKEPAYHMLPATEILCFGTAGCNFRCKFCHNWHLSQSAIEDMDFVYDITPEKAVAIAQEKKIPTISFTYNEPTSFYEYLYDVAKIAKSRGLKILFHSNGSMSPPALKELLTFVDAVTIDLKGFTKEFYETVSSAKIEPVLETLKIIKAENKWLEIVNLLIPTLNDKYEDIRQMCLWIKENLGANVPLHFSRFFPNYKLTNISPTPVKTLETAHYIARDVGLKFVTIGNLPGHKFNSTFCPKCNKLLIHRIHFEVREINIIDGKCKYCKLPIPGIWK